MATIPIPSNIDIAADNQQTAVKEVLTAKYADAGAWTTYGATLLTDFMSDIQQLLNSATAGTDLSTIATAIAAIELYTPPGTGFTYNAPDAPQYDDIPVYEAQTLDTVLGIPAVEVITVGDAPSTDIVFTNSAFTDSLLDSLKTRLAADITTSSTGLGDAEAALFARETARQNDVRTKAYSEVTTQFSARGYDEPPGALNAKIKEANDTSTIRLSDSSSQIMAESARLAVDYNKSVLSNASQLLDLVSRVFDSGIMRDFEAAKAKVQYAIEGFKQIVSVALAKAELNKTAITATTAANQGTVEVFTAKIAGQIEPIKAIAETNQAKAAAYSAAVQAASANLTAQMAPEELKLKGVVANSTIAGTKAEIALKEAMMVIEDARRQVELEVQTLLGLAGGAQQIIAGALNGVSVSSSFGFGGSATSSSTHSYDTNVAYKAADGQLPILRD